MGQEWFPALKDGQQTIPDRLCVKWIPTVDRLQIQRQQVSGGQGHQIGAEERQVVPAAGVDHQVENGSRCSSFHTGSPHLAQFLGLTRPGGGVDCYGLGLGPSGSGLLKKLLGYRVSDGIELLKHLDRMLQKGLPSPVREIDGFKTVGAG